MKEKFEHNHAIDSLEESIFLTIGQKAIEYKALNLSQGFPDFNFHEKILDTITQCAKENVHQYAPPRGHIQLRNNLSNLISQRYKHSFNSMEEILICAGATQGIFITLLALLNEKDKVLLFSPFYDSYLASIRLAKATPLEFPLDLENPMESINFNRLEEFLKVHRPKMIVFNNPHNPSGICFSKSQLLHLLQLATKYDCYLLSDEVYEYLTYDGFQHIPLYTLNSNNFEKLITISSAGKTFGYTGHKIGWVLSNSEIISHLLKVHQYNVFCVNTPFQWAYAQVLEEKSFTAYVKAFQLLYQEKRDYIIKILEQKNCQILKPLGSYFILVKIPTQFNNSFEYCLKLLEEKKLASIPISSFYLDKKTANQEYIRLCFAKKEETLKALENIEF